MQKLVVGSLVLMLSILGWSGSGFAQEVATPRGELRIVDKHALNPALRRFAKRTPANTVAARRRIADAFIEANRYLD